MVANRTLRPQDFLNVLESCGFVVEVGASLSAMAEADGIAQLPPEDEVIEPGALLRFERF